MTKDLTVAETFSSRMAALTRQKAATSVRNRNEMGGSVEASDTAE